MKTEKIKIEDEKEKKTESGKTKKVVLEETKKVKTNPVINKCDMVEMKNNSIVKKNHKTLKLVLKIIVLAILAISLARVPYVGSYIDGLFDFIFGQTKYAFYAWMIFTFVMLIFNGRVARIIKTKRYFVFSLLSLLAIGCIISGSVDFIKYFNKDRPSFVDIMNGYTSDWLTYFKGTSYSAYFNTHISGGILAVLLSFLFNFVSYVVLIIFAAILLIICVLFIFNINYKSTKVGLKVRGYIIRKLGGSFKYDAFNELTVNSDNQNKFSKAKKREIEKSAQQSQEINFDLLPVTDINNDNRNWKKATLAQAKLANLFKEEDVDCVTGDVNIYTSFSEICFEVKSSSDIKKIVALQEKISKAIKLDKFNISYRGNTLAIDFDNVYFSKLSLRSVSSLFNRKPMTAFFGINKNKKIATHELKLSPTSLIIGKKGSGSATLTVLLALTTCFSTKPEDLDLVVLNPNCEQTYADFKNVPHTSGKTFESIADVTQELHELQSIINQRSSLLALNGVDNIEQFNKVSNDSTSIMKYILVVIPNFESTIRETFQNSKIIEDLLTDGPKVGVYTILQSYNVNNEVMDPGIYNNTNDKYIFALESKNESVRIFQNERGFQLHSNGDCLHFIKDKIKSMERIQVCNINKSELAADIEIVKTFYSVKKTQNQEAILEEKTNDQDII